MLVCADAEPKAAGEAMPDTATIIERAAGQAAAPSDDRVVQFRSDGLGLSPVAYARLLAEIAETHGIAVDDYSRDGIVAELEARMAALFGKERAVFLPTGTNPSASALIALPAPALGEARGGKTAPAPDDYRIQ
jgi:hypothetical protein